MNIEIIDKYINCNMIDDLIQYFNSLNSNDYNVSIDYVLNKMINYKMPLESKKRNTAALVLSELKCNKAVPEIIDLIKKDQDSNYIGTLIYALQNLECVEYLDQIFYLMYKGNYEVRRNIYSLLELNIEKIPLEIYKELSINLDKEINNYKDILLGLYIAKDEIFNKE